jgi:hypothetical protein
MQQRFASFSGIGHKREETAVERQFFLCHAPMEAQPALQEQPEPFHGIDMEFPPAIALFISGVFSLSMVATLMGESPDT